MVDGGRARVAGTATWASGPSGTSGTRAHEEAADGGQAPAQVRAWLSRNAEKRQRILGVIEFCRLQPDEKTELRLPRNFADHKLVKLWDASPSSIKTYRDNKKAYLLTPGENPVARNFMPEYEFPVISIGKTMASEYFSQHDNSDPFEKLCVNDFSELNDKMTWLNHILVSV